MKPTLQFRLSQHLALTPQLQQSIKLLQLSTVDLNQEVERLLADNPALERDEGDSFVGPLGASSSPSSANEPEVAPVAEDWGIDDAASWRGQEDDADAERSFSAPDTRSLRDHLYGQLSLIHLGAHDRALVAALIDSLDDDGYLTMSLEEVAAILSPGTPIEAEELSIALKHLQCLEPIGVGARSPAECLALQLRALAPDGAATEQALIVALEIAEHHLLLLANRDYTRLKRATGANDETLRAAHQLILRLNPRPGAAFTSVEAGYVVPDVIVRKLRNAWRASLNPEAMPRLRINRLYAELGPRSRGTLGGKI
ncbi:MAG: RNA polymerase factor sigma-54, partial [Betaproteobacteria bacterium]|nr:RNA polymerase factor sigma-54 [Betaproteobacteria bacterium]